MPEAVIVDTLRTPIGRAFKGSLTQLRPEETGAFVIDQLLERNPDVDPALVEDVICGVGMPQGLQAFNIGRIMVLLAENLREETNGLTVSRYCASSLDAIRHASNAVKNGEGDAYIAAGVEFVSRFNERSEVAGADDRNELLTGDHEGYPNVYIDMGITAVNVAEKYGVTRDQMDDYALRSQHLAVGSQESGFFDREIVPVSDAERRGRHRRRPPQGRGRHAREARLAEGGLRRRRRHRRQLLPAQRRRRGRPDHVRHEGEGARPEAARPDRHRRHPRATTPSTWGSPRSVPSRRSSTGPG